MAGKSAWQCLRGCGFLTPSGVLLIPIVLYQKLISPLLPPCCRFTPSCSQYAAEAIMVHGVFYGSWLAFRRILRCNPFGGSGYDPVPPKRRKERDYERRKTQQ